MGSLLLFLNIIYVSITSAGERWARGKVLGLEVSEKLERYCGKERQQKVCRHSWKKWNDRGCRRYSLILEVEIWGEKKE